MGQSIQASGSRVPSSTRATASNRPGLDCRLPDRHVPVAVGIGLHHRAHLGRGDEAAELPDVVPDSTQVDLDGSRPHQAHLPISSSNLPAVTDSRRDNSPAATPCQ